MPYWISAQCSSGTKLLIIYISCYYEENMIKQINTWDVTKSTKEKYKKS